MSDDRPSRTTDIWVVRVALMTFPQNDTHLSTRSVSSMIFFLLEKEELYPLPRRDLLDICISRSA